MLKDIVNDYEVISCPHKLMIDIYPISVNVIFFLFAGTLTGIGDLKIK